MQDKELKNRVRAFTGAFIVMISPVLLAILLKKVNLSGAGKYQGNRMLELLVGLVQRSFAHLAGATLLMGILPFLCVMASEACDILPPLSYVATRLKAATKALLFVANVLLMVLGCGILLLFHRNVFLVVTFCSIMAVGATVVNIIIIVIGYSCDRGTEDEDTTAENHSELEHLLEFSASVTVMMFLLLEYVVLEGLLRNSQGQTVFLGVAQPPAPTPSDAQGQGQETFLGGTLLISFVTTAFGVSLMNLWTVFGTIPRPWTPQSELEPELEAGAANCGSESLGEPGSASSSNHAEVQQQRKRHQTTPKSKSKTVTLTATLPWCLNFILHAVPVAAVLVLITLEVLPHKLKPAVWLPFFPPAIVLLMLLARCSCEEDRTDKEDQRQAGKGEQVEIQMEPPAEQVQEIVSSGSASASSSAPGKAQQPEDKDKKPKDEKEPTDKPAPLELTKVAFTGFLAVAVPGVTNASVGIPSIVFVLSAAATVLMGLLWRLLTTHEAEAKPPSYVLKAANHASFGAHLLILFAGVAFWVMAVNV